MMFQHQTGKPWMTFQASWKEVNDMTKLSEYRAAAGALLACSRDGTVIC